jgi:hypothetical protein
MDAMKATIGITVRMVAVLAFLIGMPLWALSGSRLSFRILVAPPPAAIPTSGQVSEKGPSKAASIDNSQVQHFPGHGRRGSSPDTGDDDVGTTPRDAAKKTAARQPLDNTLPPLQGAGVNHPAATEIRGIQQRLVAKGADAMLLEMQDTDPVSYRFQCQMPISTSRIYGRRFEAVASDPVTAMRQVLAEVDAWQLRASGIRQQ